VVTVDGTSISGAATLNLKDRIDPKITAALAIIVSQGGKHTVNADMRTAPGRHGFPYLPLNSGGSTYLATHLTLRRKCS
jgi:hypothetical protein